VEKINKGELGVKKNGGERNLEKGKPRWEKIEVTVDAGGPRLLRPSQRGGFFLNEESVLKDEYPPPGKQAVLR